MRFGEKTSDFSKFVVCPHGQERREVEPVRTFSGQGGQFFAMLCRRPLWTAPKFNECFFAKNATMHCRLRNGAVILDFFDQ